jgi:hypothetical protein
VLGRVKRAEEALIRREHDTATNVGYATLQPGLGELTDIAGLVAAPLAISTRFALLRAAMRLPGAQINLHGHDPSAARAYR